MTSQTNKATVITEDLDAPTSVAVPTPAPAPSITATPTSASVPSSNSEPVFVDAEPAPKQKNTKQVSSDGLKKILIVEDERPLAKALESKLNSSGFSAKAALNGAEALEIIAAETFDLILTDLLMPIMDGWDLLKELQKQADGPTTIVLSNLGQSEDLEKAKQLNAKDFWVKSDLSLAEIVNLVKEELI